MDVIVKNYEHYNRALGKHISTKKQYFDELKRNGYVPYEEGCRLAEKKQQDRKEYKPSKECVEMMRTIMDKKKDKTIVLGQHPKLVDGMKKMGMRFDIPDPKHYKE